MRDGFLRFNLLHLSTFYFLLSTKEEGNRKGAKTLREWNNLESGNLKSGISCAGTKIACVSGKGSGMRAAGAKISELPGVIQVYLSTSFYILLSTFYKRGS